VSGVIVHLFGGPKDGETLALPRTQLVIEFVSPIYGEREDDLSFPLVGHALHTYRLGDDQELGDEHLEYDYIGWKEEALCSPSQT